MKIKVSEATNNQLNWMVAKCIYPHGSDEWLSCISAQEHHCTDWSQGGPIIEREGVGIWPPDDTHPYWSAGKEGLTQATFGPTPLIAAIRCFVVSKLGEEVEVPEELT